MSLSGDLFCEMFPYHVTFDENLIILQCGDILESMLGVPLDKSPLMSDAFRVIYPRMSLTLANIRHFINSIFVLAVLPKDGKGTSLSMKGKERSRLDRLFWLLYYLCMMQSNIE